MKAAKKDILLIDVDTVDMSSNMETEGDATLAKIYAQDCFLNNKPIVVEDTDGRIHVFNQSKVVCVRIEVKKSRPDKVDVTPYEKQPGTEHIEVET